ncbi:receptor-like kinase TMK3 [Iris pallida]|uniref:non-specific serine/threonine protein kinase n=1 Tax=Iris pallida TaxID=29817 RepID=A0AAX6FXF3_IRIPA|nr:receptor-like kinase TMK3 [Iris pallida]
MVDWHMLIFVASIVLFFHSSCVLVVGVTDADDFAVLEEFRRGLENPELLQWPSAGDDPCGPPLWPHVFCSGSRVSQIQVQSVGLVGPLPRGLNKLSMLTNLGLQKNHFSGPLPTFSGLSNLVYAYLGGNKFDSIPADFFVGLTSLQVLSLDDSPLNQSTGWTLPKDLESSAQLMNLSLIRCNLKGPLPGFLGGMQFLRALKLSYNSLSGDVPKSFSGSAVQILWLNNQAETGLTGTIDVVASMTSLTEAWLHGNSFSGPIPAAMGQCTSLTRLWLNDNQLVGRIPEDLTSLPLLQSLQLGNNKLMGPIPKVKIANFTFDGNSFCQPTPGSPCSPEVNALLDFLEGVNYPSLLTSSWSGNNPCSSSWLGVSCPAGKISLITLQNSNLSGVISPSIGRLDSLVDIKLGGNNLIGTIPKELANLKSLKMLNLSANNLRPPVPKFGSGVTLVTYGNPLLELETSEPPVSPPRTNPAPKASPPPFSESPPPMHRPIPPGSSPGSGHEPLAPSKTLPPVSSPGPGNAPLVPGNSTRPAKPEPPSGRGAKLGDTATEKPAKHSTRSRLLIIIVPSVIGVLVFSLIVLLLCCRRWGRMGVLKAPSSFVVHPRDVSNPDDMLKITVANNPGNSSAPSDFQSGSNNSGMSDKHAIESGNLVVSLQILRSLTNNFSLENEVGRGGFGVVYKGELHDGTMIAVKRMEAAKISNKAFDEFQAEIAVLSKVRHRNLVSLLGYSVEGDERLLVYEYMPQGALSKHLFQWKQFNLEPLSWKKRLYIALDIARGVEYMHNLTHQCFIHRDLKSSNILLGDDYRAKVSDFGLVKLAPDGKNSVTTRLAGTFGYLAPEYAVTGKITTKADVFSFGVVLMELLTGLTALDENRSEESRYLASWFSDLKSDKEKLQAAIDSSLELTEETSESILIIAELACHCAAREPHQRPDMGHAVSVLAPLAEKWKPMEEDQEDRLGIDLHQPLLLMVKGWQADEGSCGSSVGPDDSKGSIPARPPGFADSLTSADGR